jgi:ubiquinone/menaquinone biosynthesis C-methylase UbiE
MSAQYDAIADQYRRSRESPLRQFVEAFTLDSLVGDVSGKRVLDLACGDGFYTRRFKAAGADKVVGVDVSSAMIDLAKQQERSDPLGVEYVCAPVEAMPDLGNFDLVIAAYLLHYAESERHLLDMSGNIAGHLAADGRFVALNENPDQSVSEYAGYDQYGFNKTCEAPRQEGSLITYWMVAGREMFSFQARYFSRATYERVLHQAGFSRIEWHPLSLDPLGLAAHGSEYWQEYLGNPPVIALECRL